MFILGISKNTMPEHFYLGPAVSINQFHTGFNLF